VTQSEPDFDPEAVGQGNGKASFSAQQSLKTYVYTSGER